MSIALVRRLAARLAASVLALGIAGIGPMALEAAGQQIAYSGKLQIGFGDQDNVAGFPMSNAIPICAGGGPLVNPGTVGTTLGTLLMNGVATASPGVGSSIVFEGVQGSSGGAEVREPSTCRTSIPPFANPRLRSRTRVGSAYFPGRKGPFTPNIDSAFVPLIAPVYTLSAGGGNDEPTTITNWTTMATASAPAMSFTGAAYETTLPMLDPGEGVERVQPGPARFGGALPFSGSAGVQVGINGTGCCGSTFGGPPVMDFGVVSYFNGFVPYGPIYLGTDAEGIAIRNQITTTIFPSSATYARGLVAGLHDATFAARTPGGSTIHQQGAIRTIGGGNTQTPVLTVPGTPIVSPIAFTGVYGEWTTGAVTHTNRVGDFTTVRKAQGFDIAPTAGTRISNETRRLQVVSPWSATIRPIGPFGLPVAETAFGGVAVLTLNLIPAPEPGVAVSLLFGSALLAGGRTRGAVFRRGPVRR